MVSDCPRKIHQASKILQRSEPMTSIHFGRWNHFLGRFTIWLFNIAMEAMTGAGAGSGSTRFRRRVRRFRRRCGRLWCRARSRSTGFRRRLGRRFRGGVGAEPGHRVPEKALGGFGALPGQVQQGSKVPEKVWEPSVQPVSFPEKVWEALVQSQVKFNRVPENQEVWVQSQVRFGSEDGLAGRFGAGSAGFRRSFRRRSGRLCCRAWLGSTKVWEALAQRRVRFNRVPEKVREKVWEALVQSQVKLNRVPEKGSGEGFGEGSRKPWCKAKSGSTGSGEGCRAGRREGFGNLWCRARSGQGFQRRVSSAWLRSTLQKDL